MPATKMSLDLIQDMVTNYKSKQYLSIVTNTINPMTFDAKSVRFDLQSLKEFINTIETEVALHPEYGLQNLGIRLYYAAYPDSDLWDQEGYEDIEGLDDSYAKLHTVIAIPTAEIDGVQCDFDPLDVTTYNGKRPVGVGLAIMAENHGDLNPPGGASGLWF